MSFTIPLICQPWIAVFIPCPDARAWDWSFTPSISLSHSYDSNILFVSDAPMEDFITHLKPVLVYSLDGEKTEFRLNSVIRAEKYWEHSSLDTVATDSSASVNYNWSPRFSTGIKADFIRDTTLNTQLEQAGIPADRVERNIYRVGLDEKYVLTETVSLRLGQSGGETRYAEEVYPDSRFWLLNFGPSWAVTPRDTLGIDFTYSYNDYIDTATVKDAAGLLFWERALNETTSVKAGAGYRFTWLKNDVSALAILGDRLVVVQRSVESNDNGVLFLAALKTDWTERLSTSVTAGRDQYTSSDAVTYERSYVRTSVAYRISELTSCRLDAKYDFNQQQGGGNEEVQYVSAASSVERKITRDISLKLAAAYEYSLTDSDADNSDVDRFRTWVEVSYYWPRFFAEH